MKEEPPILLIIATIAVLCALAMLTGFAAADAANSKVRREAIEHNAAEWQIDAKTGEKRFVWKGQPAP